MKVAVFGLGYVGAVTSACLAAKGHDVWGVDIDQTKVDMIRAGLSPVSEPGLSELINEVVQSGHLHATTDAVQALVRADASLLCVGTPSTAEGRTNLTYVYRVVDDLVAGLKEVKPPTSRFHAVVMRSTVPPGTVDGIGEIIRAELDPTGLATGVAMCPEFLRESTGISDFYSPPFTIVGSSDPDVVQVVGELFGFIEAPQRVVEVRTAEALKYACNAFHAAKVSFTNELGRLFRRLGVDNREVMSLFCEDRQLNISERYLRPGFAFGGSCLPKDLRSLLHMARMESVDLPMLSGTLTTNQLCVSEVVERLVEGEGRTVALLGLSFKEQSDDLRDSPFVDLAETLLGKGYDVRIYDPIVNPAALIGSNRQYVESKLPHLRAILKNSASDALDHADVAIVCFAATEVADAVVAASPSRVLDLDGRLGEAVEALPGYEGVSW
jgi:GDP-mannose 6-dehydrogenase